MLILLLRHGETEWNVSGRLQGSTDTALTATGLRQAHDAAASMPRFAAVWSSPLRRAKDTADVVAAAQGHRHVRDDPRLVERSWGEWEGLLPAEVDRRWPGWRRTGRTPPGYEYDHLSFGRFTAWLDDVRQEPSDRVVLAVSHGGLMGAVERTLGGEASGYRNLEGIWIERAGSGVRLVGRRRFVDDARELTR